MIWKYKKNLIILFLLLLILSIFFYVNNNIQFYNNNNIEFYDNNNNNIEIVVSRFNEKLDWLKEEPFNKYPVICYNSGFDEDFYKPYNMKNVKIDNIGKEAYIYLYHIIKNYDNLANITIFLPGSTNNPKKIEKAKRQIYEVENNNNTVFISFQSNNIQKDNYDFILDEWCSTSEENIKINSICKLNPSKIRPFGNWYEHFFKGKETTRFNTFGILGIHKKNILQNSKEYYENLLNEFVEPNDEVAHYFERAWQAIFYPMDDVIYLDG